MQTNTICKWQYDHWSTINGDFQTPRAVCKHINPAFKFNQLYLAIAPLVIAPLVIAAGT
jgi:hypothetical protein